MDGDYRMKKRLRWVMGIALGILLCGAVFYVLCIVEEISTPKKLCTTLQEAIDSNKEFAGYTEVLTQAEANGYTLVVVKMPDQKTDLRIQTGVFLKTNKGWAVPAKKNSLCLNSDLRCTEWLLLCGCVSDCRSKRLLHQC